MIVNYREFRFLVFFLPIFFLKLLNYVASSKELIVVSIICFIWFLSGLLIEHIPLKKLIMLILLVGYSGLLIITCGKQGAFFSAIMIFALNGISFQKNIYKVCFWVGTVGVLISCYLERNGTTRMRYISGTWTLMYKRSNILYIAFVAVICMYLYSRKQIKYLHILLISVMSYIMYSYTGCRTGILSITVLIGLLLVFKIGTLAEFKILKWGCILSPAIGMGISLYTNMYYGKVSFLYTLNSMMQGRLAQGKAYLDEYNLKLLGQPIYESNNPKDFHNLDCAYLDMLICYGVVFAVVWVIFSCLVIKYLYEKKRYAEVATIVMYAVYGISETFLPNCFLNVSLFLYAEFLYSILNRTIDKRALISIKHRSFNKCFEMEII